MKVWMALFSWMRSGKERWLQQPVVEDIPSTYGELNEAKPFSGSSPHSMKVTAK